MKVLLLLLFAVLPLCSCRPSKSETRPTPQKVEQPLPPQEETKVGLANPAAPEAKNDGQRVEFFARTKESSRRAVGASADAVAGMSYNEYCMRAPMPVRTQGPVNTEEYDVISENDFHQVEKSPLSTFSIDVDAASYANARRFLNSNQLPPADAVRIEEFINYFPYQYEAPENSAPVAIHADVANSPWAKEHRLVRIGLKGREIKTAGLPSSNLVFLIDVSGSMQDANKLPLLKKAFRLLVNQLREKDTVAIVVYAGSAGLVLPPTNGEHRERILDAIDRLEAGGSTAGGAGINLAYETARKHFVKNGNNRVILATDGDFNVGTSSDEELVRLIEEKRKNGIFLTVLGFGTGNVKDSKMEKLADKGNGNYAYIDNILEARKVLVSEMGATLHTIAKDVKIQVEFNPARVQAYRLIGYENRLLKDEDFNDDRKDAGEMGAGGTVTALYEVVPVGVKSNVASVDPLKYQINKAAPRTTDSDELMTVKFRYKEPKGDTSKMVSLAVKDRGAELSEMSDDFRFASAVAGFGMLLRDSEFKNDLTYKQVIDLAKSAVGEDPEGYRAEFLKMVKTGQTLKS